MTTRCRESRHGEEKSQESKSLCRLGVWYEAKENSKAMRVVSHSPLSIAWNLECSSAAGLWSCGGGKKRKRMGKFSVVLMPARGIEAEIRIRAQISLRIGTENRSGE